MKKDLALPTELIDDENVEKMLILLFPQSLKRFCHQHGSTESKSLFANIFRANSNSLRCKFFSDSLVRHLWGQIFTSECEEEIKSYLCHVRSQTKEGEIKFMRLHKKML